VAQQHFGIPIAAQTCGHFGEHPERRDIGGLFAYLRPQQRFGFRQPIVVKRGAGGAHARIAGGALDVLPIGKVGVTHIADVGVDFSERQPCGRKVRLQCHCTAEGSDCFAAAPKPA
jgi:hypothetical protein